MLVLVVIVIVGEPSPTTVAPGEKFAFAPLGSPDAVRLTVPLKPPIEVTYTVVLVLEPALTDGRRGHVPSEKSGEEPGLPEHSDTPMECWRLPLVPVIVSG